MYGSVAYLTHGDERSCGVEPWMSSTPQQYLS